MGCTGSRLNRGGEGSRSRFFSLSRLSMSKSREVAGNAQKSNNRSSNSHSKRSRRLNRSYRRAVHHSNNRSRRSTNSNCSADTARESIDASSCPQCIEETRQRQLQQSIQQLQQSNTQIIKIESSNPLAVVPRNPVTPTFPPPEPEPSQSSPLSLPPPRLPITPPQPSLPQPSPPQQSSPQQSLPTSSSQPSSLPSLQSNTESQSIPNTETKTSPKKEIGRLSSKSSLRTTSSVSSVSSGNSQQRKPFPKPTRVSSKVLIVNQLPLQHRSLLDIGTKSIHSNIKLGQPSSKRQLSRSSLNTSSSISSVSSRTSTKRKPFPKPTRLPSKVFIADHPPPPPPPVSGPLVTSPSKTLAKQPISNATTSSSTPSK